MGVRLWENFIANANICCLFVDIIFTRKTLYKKKKEHFCQSRHAVEHINNLKRFDKNTTTFCG